MLINIIFIFYLLATSTSYNVNAYIDGKLVPQIKQCNLVTAYNLNEVLFKCSQTEEPYQDLGSGTITFYINLINTKEAVVIYEGTAKANRKQVLYFVLTTKMHGPFFPQDSDIPLI